MSDVTSADATPDDTEARTRLGRIVENRRLELGTSVRAAATKAGVARDTWTGLEEATRRTAKHAYAGIEQALSWAPGSIQAILDGGEPIPVQPEQATAAPASAGPPAALTDGIADDPVMRILNSSAPAEVKQEIVKRLLAEQRAFAQRRVDELLREALERQ